MWFWGEYEVVVYEEYVGVDVFGDEIMFIC